MDRTYDIRLRSFFGLLIAGPSRVGKSTLIRQILRNADKIIAPNGRPDKIVWATGSQLSREDHQMAEEKLVDSFIEGSLPDEQELYGIARTCPNGMLLVLDDFMDRVEQAPLIRNLFTKAIHHERISTIFVTQNLFARGSAFRTVSLNATDIIIFQNVRDKSSIMHFARQFAPTNIPFVMNAYTDAVKINHGYIHFDMRTDTFEEIRVRSNYFGENGDPQAVTVYQPVALQLKNRI